MRLNLIYFPTSLADQMDRNVLTDPIKNYDILYDQIQALNNKHLPHRYVKANKQWYKRSKWITYGIINSIKHRDFL